MRVLFRCCMHFTLCWISLIYTPRISSQGRCALIIIVNCIAFVFSVVTFCINWVRRRMAVSPPLSSVYFSKCNSELIKIRRKLLVIHYLSDAYSQLILCKRLRFEYYWRFFWSNEMTHLIIEPTKQILFAVNFHHDFFNGIKYVGFKLLIKSCSYCCLKMLRCNQST